MPLPGNPSDTEVLNRTRILAIDDDPLVLETYRKIFRERVEALPTVAAALGKLRKEADLRIVIVDFAMRDGGFQLLTTLRRKFPDRVAIAIWDKFPPPDPQEIKELGVFRCFERSHAQPPVLEDAIREAIGLLRCQAKTP